jgi:aminoglycoside phosphotransferase (APT) family kinase protein
LESQEQAEAVRPLVDHLAAGMRRPDEEWDGWRIARVAGGQNNLLYRATGAAGDLAVKFTMRDERDRAGREYAALSAIQQSSAQIAPCPVLLDRTTYPQPVVVQTWIEGEVAAVPPETDAEWMNLLQHLALVHAIKPGNATVGLPEAVLNAYSVSEAKQLVRQQVARVPTEARSDSLRDFVARLEGIEFPKWPDAHVSLCRNDNNISNFIRRPDLWASVDWEYSGWGDPGFDLATLITHPAYVAVPPSRWEWVIDAYCGLVDDAGAGVRTRVYTRILAVWWVARVSRLLSEVPMGLDNRLKAWPDGWRAAGLAKYEHYVRLAEAVCG